MGTNRLEAFSDGVIAVIITIMVLELKVPRDTTLSSLRSLAPQFLSYLLSFLVVAIMWVNHHHLLHSGSLIHLAFAGFLGQPHNLAHLIGYLALGGGSGGSPPILGQRG